MSVGVVCIGGTGVSGLLVIDEVSLETGTSSLEIIVSSSLDVIISGIDSTVICMAETPPL